MFDELPGTKNLTRRLKITEKYIAWYDRLIRPKLSEIIFVESAQIEFFLNSFFDDFVRKSLAIYHCLIFRRRVYSEIFHSSNCAQIWYLGSESMTLKMLIFFQILVNFERLAKKQIVFCLFAAVNLGKNYKIRENLVCIFRQRTTFPSTTSFHIRILLLRDLSLFGS